MLTVPVEAYVNARASEEQHRRDEADDDVGHARADLLEPAAERDQHVARGQHHLDGDEQVEQVAGEERGRHAGGQDHVHGLEPDVVALDAGLADGVHEHGEQHDATPSAA